MHHLNRRSLLAATTAVGALTVIPGRGQAAVRRLEIVAPASPGGGWDQTARAMQAALQEADLASSVQVQNISGAGGTIGLAQFATSKRGRGNSILSAGSSWWALFSPTSRR